MKNHIKFQFDKLVLDIAGMIESDGLDAATTYLSRLIHGIVYRHISYLNFSKQDHIILVKSLEKELELLKSGEKISTNFRLCRERVYKLQLLADQSGLDKTKVLELLIDEAKHIKMEVVK